MASMLDRVADLERQPSASMAIQRVTGTDGVRRYVVLLSGMRQFAPSPDPEDLLGAAAALVGTTTNYTRCVSQALDAAQVPRGAQVLLVGHSEGGLVAMDLAGDGAFSGARVRVTQVVAAGAPISSKMVVFGGGTRVLSIENVHDVVTHLDADDPPIGHQRADRLTYRFAIDEHDVVRSHDVRLYAQQAEVLADSPNPLMIWLPGRFANHISLAQQRRPYSPCVTGRRGDLAQWSGAGGRLGTRLAEGGYNGSKLIGQPRRQDDERGIENRGHEPHQESC
jgi:pimeloyl-ACP methyl ester carboxylesterase